MTTKQRILRAAGKRGKTKWGIATSVGISYSHAAKLTNDLHSTGDLRIVSIDGDGASVFACTSSPTPTSTSRSRSASRK